MPVPKVLVVDDQPVNVQILRKRLEREGIRVATAASGSESLECVKRERPDLILLDWMMPDMDGIEVCEQLQADEETRTIPIIFVTAKTGKESKIDALGTGAVDYLTKPVDLDDMAARVRTQLRFVMIHREVIELNRRLEQALHAASIGAVTQGIAHNLNNLLSIVIGYLDLIKINYGQPDQVKKNVERIEEAAHRIVGIVRQLNSIAVKTRPPMAEISLQVAIDAGIARFRRDHEIAAPIAVENSLGALPVETNLEVLEEAIAKLLINAWESYGNDPDEPRPISIQTKVADQTDGAAFVEIRVEDRGRGIDPEIRHHLFEPFISTKRTVGVGMGLSIVQHCLHSLGGEVAVVDRPGGGASATIRHPLHRRPH